MSINWSVFAIQRLRDYETRKEAANNLIKQIKELEDKAVSIRVPAPDGISVQGGNENKQENLLINNIATREELQRNLDIVQSEIEITEKGLASLTPEETKILTMFYMSRAKGYVDRLCNDLYISKTELYRQKDDALKKFTLVCYGIVEI